MTANLLFAWCWILVGLLSGTVQGLFFHREEWLGGYGSWRRRMTRLGHIAFFGTGLINLLAAISVKLWLVQPSGAALRGSSLLLMAGAVSMSTVCYLSAWKKPLRHLFFIPVVSLICGVGCLIALLMEAAA
jgi:hypothetical protein